MSAFAFPAQPYIPGQTPRPDEKTFDAIKSQALMPTSSTTADANRAFQVGLDLLEAGYYWEAHEVLEAVWMNAAANTPERFMVQALIQLANAALKRAMRRPNAVRRLTEIAEELLCRAGTEHDQVMGCRIDLVRDAIAMLGDKQDRDHPLHLRVRIT